METLAPGRKGPIPVRHTYEDARNESGVFSESTGWAIKGDIALLIVITGLTTD